MTLVQRPIYIVVASLRFGKIAVIGDNGRVVDSENEIQPVRRIEILTYTSGQVCVALQISKVTLWRLEKRGILKPLPYLRHKRYSVESVTRFSRS